MAEIHNIDEHLPAVEVDIDGVIMTHKVRVIRGVADGTISIAEFIDPEMCARSLAIMAMELIEGNNVD